MKRFLGNLSRVASSLGILAALAVSPHVASAQQISIDRGVRAAGLWCFPLANNPNEYLYLPAGAQLGTNRSGGPEFSYLRYVENVKGAGRFVQHHHRSDRRRLATFSRALRHARRASCQSQKSSRRRDRQPRSQAARAAGFQRRALYHRVIACQSRRAARCARRRA